MVCENTEMDMTKLEAGNAEVEQKFEKKNDKGMLLRKVMLFIKVCDFFIIA